MSSLRPHAVVVSFPAPGQLNPTLDLANLLRVQGFLVTFVNTSSGRQRILQTSQAFPPESDLLRFETIPDGYSLDSAGAPNNEELRRSIKRTCAAHLGQLLRRLKRDPVLPPVSCVIANFLIASETVEAAEEMGIPFFVLWTTSACSLLGSLHLRDLIRRGYTPLKGKTATTQNHHFGYNILYLLAQFCCLCFEMPCAPSKLANRLSYFTNPKLACALRVHAIGRTRDCLYFQ